MRSKHPDNLPGMNEDAVDILDSISDAFLAIDRDTRIVYVNKEAGRILGRDLTELVGKHIFDIIPEASNWMFHRQLQKAISEGVQVKLNNFLLKNKRFTTYFYPNKNGITILLHDITIQWQVDELYRLALVLLDRLNESVYLVRSDGRLFHVNDEISRLLGYSRDELIHMKVFDIEPGITVKGWESYFTRIKQGAHVDFESGLRTRDDRIIPVAVCANYVQLYGSEYYCVAARDITERKKLEEALIDAEDFNRSVLDSLPSNIAVLDESGIIVYVNSSWRKFARGNGASSDEAVGVGINYIDVCQKACGPNAEEASDVVSGILSVLKGEQETFELEYPCHSPDVKRWFQLRVTPFIGRKISGVVVYHNDITRRRMSEEALRRSESSLARAQNIAHIGNWDWDLKTSNIEWSDECYHVFGHRPGDVKPITYDFFISHLHPDDVERMNRAVRESIQSRTPLSIDFRIIKPDTSTGYAHNEADVQYDKEGEPVRIFGTVQDITERKRAEVALRNSESSLAKSQEMAHIGNWELDVATGEIVRSMESYRIFGLDPDESAIDYADFLAFIVPEDRERVDSTIKSTMKSGQSYRVTYNIRRKDGEIRTLLSHGEASCDTSGQVVKIYSTHQDITERKRAEEERKRLLHELGERVKELGALHGAYEIMQKGRSVPEVLQEIVDILPPAWQYPEITVARIMFDGKEYKTPNFLEAPWKQRADILTVDGKHGAIEVYYLEKRPDETEGPFLSEERGLMNSLAEMLRIYLDKWYAEEALIDAKNQSELYLDLMSHDINNLNQVALGYLDLIDGTSTDEKLKELIAKPIDAVTNSSHLIENVQKLQKARTGQHKLEAVDLDKILSGLHAQYSRVQGKDIAINYTHDPDCSVMADGLINDVFSNLIWNAIKHSDGESVRVYIELKMQQEGKKKYCRVTIADDGPGIPDEQKDKIFARFQRGKTKASGKGLGLYLVKTLVEGYHGKVWVEDRVSGDHTKGAKFMVMLPMVER